MPVAGTTFFGGAPTTATGLPVMQARRPALGGSVLYGIPGRSQILGMHGFGGASAFAPAGGGGGGFGGGGGGGNGRVGSAEYAAYQTTAQLRANGMLLGGQRGATPAPAGAGFGRVGGLYGLQTSPTEQQTQNAAMMRDKYAASEANADNPDFQLHSWGNAPGQGELNPAAHSWDQPAPGFAAGTVDSGAKSIFASLGEQGREAVIPPDGVGYMVGEDGPTQGVLPAHSMVVPNDVVEGQFADEVQPSGMAAQYMGPKPSATGANRVIAAGAEAAQQNNPGPGQGMAVGGQIVPKPEFNAGQNIPWPAADRSASGIYGVNPMSATPPPMVPGYAGMKGTPTSRQADIPQMIDNMLKGGSPSQKLAALQVLQHGTMQANSQDFERNRLQEQRDLYNQSVQDVNQWRRNDAEAKRQQGITSHVGTSKYLEGAGILPKGTTDFVSQMHDPAEAAAFVKAAQTGYKAMNSDHEKYNGFIGALEILSKQKDSGVTPEMISDIKEHSKEPIEGTDQFKYNPGVAEKLLNHVSKLKKEQVAKFQEIKKGLGVITGANGANVSLSNVVSKNVTQPGIDATIQPQNLPFVGHTPGMHIQRPEEATYNQAFPHEKPPAQHPAQIHNFGTNEAPNWRERDPKSGKWNKVDLGEESSIQDKAFSTIAKAISDIPAAQQQTMRQSATNNQALEALIFGKK